MPANFSVQFIVNEKTQTRVLKLTDTSTGFTLAKGNFSVTFPDGSTRIKTDFLSPDISAPGAFVNIPAVLDTENNVLTGTYKIDFVALNSSNTAYNSTITFDFNWVKPKNGIVNDSDVLIPEVKFRDSNSYSPIGSFTGTLNRTLSVAFPSTSEASGNAPISTVSENTINVISSGKYYDGTYNPSCDVNVLYTYSGDNRITISYIELFTKTYLIKKCPTQIELVGKINSYRALIDAYKDKNDTQFNLLSEQYDLVIALYSHLITRYETSTQDGSEPILRELLSILEPYSTTYTPQLTRMLPFELASTGSNSFSVSDGTNTDQIPLGSTLTLSSGNPALTIGVSNNLVTYTPTFGTAINTFAQGNDSRFHNAVTIGTSNGLSLASQVLSLAAATSSSSGAMSAADKSKLDGIAAGANTGTVTSIGISVPSAFTVSNSPVTTSGTINISATGNPLQYITGAGALATLNTGAVPENGNLYFTDARSRSAISVSGSLSYNSTTGVISYTTPSETDPVFTASVAFSITSTDVTNWNTAYGWGNHASAGYLTSSLAATTYQPLDADLTAIAGLAGTSGLLKKTAANTWSLDTNTYLTSFTETDPIFVASAAYGITNTNISNWNTAYGWGNHASAGYLTSINSSQVTTALGYTPENAANKGIANGYASLDGAGLVPSTQLPSYVDDVLEYADLASLPATGATGKIYVTLDTNKIYRWSGTVYVEISSSAGGGGTWGSIIGTLSNQTDLQAALDAKQNSLGFTPVTNARTLTINGVTYDLTANRSWTVSGTMPSGGTAGQILSKIDATDYNTQWIDNYAEQVKHSVKLGATIAKGKAVYVSSADGTNMVVSAASNASESTSSKVLGLLETGGVTNDIVKVVTEGLVAGLDTSTATAGDPVWLGTSGNLIFGLANKPVAPAHLVFIGVVTRVQSNNGEIFVNVQNGFEIEELHNVLFTSKADKDLMYYDNATSLWKNAQLTTVLGYTPYDASNPAGYTTNVGTVTSVAALTIDSAGSDITSSVADSTTTPVITLSVPDASTIARGVVNNGTQTFGGSKTFSGNLSVINGSFSVTGNSTLTTSTGNTTVSISTGATVSGATKTINIGTSGLSGSTTNITIGSTAGTNTVTARGTWTFAGNITAASIIKSGGTSSQFLKADGSVDSSTYLTSYTETDPIYTASSWYTTTNNASNWDTAYGWGNHASAGYLTTSTAASTYQPLDADLTAIAGLAGTSGFLKKTAANTWSLDTNTYLTSISSLDVTNALGYTPVTNARTLTINGTTFDLTANRSWTISAGTTLNGTGFVKASGTTISYDNSTYVPTNGTGATGTWGISISGTAANTSSISSAVGSNYTWSGTQYFLRDSGGYSGSLSNASLQAYSTNNNSAFMSFHKSGVYAVNMGLDADNVFRIGGWSAAANRLQLEMNGNLTLAGDVRTTGLRLNTESQNRGLRTYSRTVDVNSYTTITGMRFTVAGGNVAQFNYEIIFRASQITGDINPTWYLRYTGSTVYNTGGTPNERFFDLREQAGNGIAGVGRNNNTGNLEFPIAAYGEGCRITITINMVCNNWDAVTVSFS